jgi:hypothetical protein
MMDIPFGAARGGWATVSSRFAGTSIGTRKTTRALLARTGFREA